MQIRPITNEPLPNLFSGGHLPLSGGSPLNRGFTCKEITLYSVPGAGFLAQCKETKLFCKVIISRLTDEEATLGTRDFSHMRREFSVLAGGRSHERRIRAGHYKDLTENGNRARKVSGTLGKEGERN